MTDATDSKQNRDDGALAVALNAILCSLNDMRMTMESVNNHLVNLSVPMASSFPPPGFPLHGSSHVAPSSPPPSPSHGPWPDGAESENLMAPLGTSTTAPYSGPSSLEVAVTVTTESPATATTVVDSAPDVPTPSAVAAAATVVVGSAPDVLTPSKASEQVAHIPSTAMNVRWFIVTSGTVPGVYSSWEETSPLVTGVSRAVYKRSPSKEEALTAYRLAWERGDVVRWS